jgi:L-malate glycosyltransferase
VEAIHQFIPTFASWDAIGSHASQVQQLVRGLGLRSEIFCQAAHGQGSAAARPVSCFSSNTPAHRTGLLYQLSTGSRLAGYLLNRPEPKLVNYHNVTPAELIHPWEPQVAMELDAGRRQLAALAHDTKLAIAVSAYNEAELIQAGYPSTVVAPVMVDVGIFDRFQDDAALAELQAAKTKGGSDWLFVGRITPNKCQHDVIKAFVAYRRMYDPKARLHLVGTSSSHAYWTALERYIAALGIVDAVHLTGPVPSGVLAAYFGVADVFVCLSEHEGFCVPLLEAMHHRLPIVAFAAAAVPETLHDAGILLHDKGPATVAAAVNRVLSDQALHVGLLAAGERRLSDFSLERTRGRWREVLGSIIR